MKNFTWLATVALLAVSGCQTAPGSRVIILNGDQVTTLAVDVPDPRAILGRAGVVLRPSDQLLADGFPTKLDGSRPPGAVVTLQIRRAVAVTINGKASQTAAATVGGAVADGGVALYSADVINPAPDTPIRAGMSITYVPSTPITVTVDGRQVAIRSAEDTVGAALADARIGPMGLDVSRPADEQPLPADGRVEVTRVTEALLLTQTSIPFQTDYRESPEIALGEQQIIQPGASGLAMTRTRIQYANGAESARNIEPQTLVRPAQNQVVATGSKLVAQTATIGGATIQYWRMLQMYATVYSPCDSATGGGGCSYGTASGLRAGKGVVAVDPALYSYLNGQRLYIPGYGFAVIGDVGGGYIVERNLGISRYKWIDLGFDDGNLQDMTGWITVYFLNPAPATIPDALK